MEQPESYRANPSDFLAVERTFLAWIRTGLALMALGFVLARFGLFLREFNLIRPTQNAAPFGYSLWFGTILILPGRPRFCSFTRPLFASRHPTEKRRTFVRQCVHSSRPPASFCSVCSAWP